MIFALLQLLSINEIDIKFVHTCVSYNYKISIKNKTGKMVILVVKISQNVKIQIFIESFSICSIFFS